MSRKLVWNVEFVFAIAIAGVVTAGSPAQNLTVHVVTDSATPKPTAGVAVQLLPQPAMPGRPKVIAQKSDE
jgi:hypothetical protein